MVLGKVDKVGDTRLRKRFAFLPEVVDDLWIWLEFYYEYSVFTAFVGMSSWEVVRTTRSERLIKYYKEVVKNESGSCENS